MQQNVQQQPQQQQHRPRHNVNIQRNGGGMVDRHNRQIPGHVGDRIRENGEPRQATLPRQVIEGSNFKELIFNNVIGQEAKKYLQEEKYAHLYSRDTVKNRLYFNDREEHPHGYSASCRSNFDRLIEHGIAPMENKLDIGGHLVRNAVSNRLPRLEGNNIVYDKYFVKTRTMAPNLGAREQLRQRQWKRMLNNNAEYQSIPIPRNRPEDSEGFYNACFTCKGRALRDIYGNLLDPEQVQTHCESCAQNFPILKAIDSAYYDGVLEEIDWRLCEHGSVAYITINDYDTPVSKGELRGKSFDNESEWSYDIHSGLVTSTVKGNPESYIHKILSTGGFDSWSYASRKPNHWIICERLQTWMNGNVPYSLIQMTAVQGERLCPIGVQQVYNPEDWRRKRVNKVVTTKTSEQTVLDVTPAIEAVLTPAAVLSKFCVKYLGESLMTRTERLRFGDDVIHMDSWRYTIFGCKKQMPTITAKVEAVVDLIGKTMGISSTQSAVMQLRKAYNDTHRLISDKESGEYIRDPSARFVRLSELKDAFIIADVIACNITSDYADYRTTSYGVALMRESLAGKAKGLLSWLNLEQLKKYIIMLLILIGTGVVVYGVTHLVYVIANLHKWFGVQAMGSETENETMTKLECLIFVLILVTLYGVKRNVKQKVHKALKTLDALCVRDNTRCDPNLQRGRIDPQLKIRDPTEWPSDIKTVMCDAKEKPGAHKIFAEILYPGYTEPTILHSCKRTVLAASLRACSNKVCYADDVMQEFSDWFTKVIIPEFLEGLDNVMLDISVEEWLSQYPEKYQKEMRKEMEKPGWDTLKHYTYESFPKVECQFTDVPVELKDTELNTVKERQISGPPNAKKILCNPIISAFEKIADKHVRGYCGGKDWPTLASEVEKMFYAVPDAVFGAADGSGFDMTQLGPQNMLLNKLIIAGVDHANVTLQFPLTREAALFCLQDSLRLDVNVARGSLNYKAEGRASGDGWTTFGNTILMLSYWRFCFYKAGIEDFGLLVKGDDVLFCIPNYRKFWLLRCVDLLFAKKQELVAYGLGQICKFIKFGPIEDMDFLSCHFFWDSQHHIRLTRIPQRVFQNLCWSTKIPYNMPYEGQLQIAKELCFAKGMCLLAWAKGLSIFEKLALKMISLGLDGSHTEFNRYVDKSRVWSNNNDRDAYNIYLFDKHNVTPEAVMRIEKAISKITSIEDVIYVPELASFFV